MKEAEQGLLRSAISEVRHRRTGEPLNPGQGGVGRRGTAALSTSVDQGGGSALLGEGFGRGGEKRERRGVGVGPPVASEYSTSRDATIRSGTRGVRKGPPHPEKLPIIVLIAVGGGGRLKNTPGVR